MPSACARFSCRRLWRQTTSLTSDLRPPTSDLRDRLNSDTPRIFCLSWVGWLGKHTDYTSVAVVAARNSWLMKPTLICTFVAASTCSALLISSAHAGGRNHERLSSSTTSAGSTASSGASIRETVSLTQSNQPAEREKARTRPSRSDRSGGVTTPTAPTSLGSSGMIGVESSSSMLFKSTNPNYIMGAFNTSILDTGLSSSKTTKPTTTTSSPQLSVVQSNLIPSSILPGPGPQGPPTLAHATISMTSQKSSSMMQSSVSSSSTTK